MWDAFKDAGGGKKPSALELISGDMKFKFRKMNIKVMDPVKVNMEFIEYEYFAHGYQGKLIYWQYALAQHDNKRMKMYFHTK
jgi:hypothetical protein